MRRRSTSISARPGFKDLEEIDDVYKIELRKPKIEITRPFQVGIVVYQLAKLRMLQFYYEFLDFYFDRRDFELIQMDTDSMYFAFAHERLEDAVRPGVRGRVRGEQEALASLGQVEQPRARPVQAREGGHLSPSRFARSATTSRTRPPARRRSPPRGSTSAKTRCALTRFERALEGSKDMATNRGFRMHNGAMFAYEQRKLGLSTYYDKRWVLPDGIHTEPIEYHQ